MRDRIFPCTIELLHAACTLGANARSAAMPRRKSRCRGRCCVRRVEEGASCSLLPPPAGVLVRWVSCEFVCVCVLMSCCLERALLLGMKLESLHVWPYSRQSGVAMWPRPSWTSCGSRSRPPKRSCAVAHASGVPRVHAHLATPSLLRLGGRAPPPSLAPDAVPSLPGAILGATAKSAGLCDETLCQWCGWQEVGRREAGGAGRSPGGDET